MKMNKLKTKAENMERSPPQIMALKMTWKKNQNLHTHKYTVFTIYKSKQPRTF